MRGLYPFNKLVGVMDACGGSLLPSSCIDLVPGKIKVVWSPVKGNYD
jgi:hypothetical protein